MSSIFFKILHKHFLKNSPLSKKHCETELENIIKNHNSKLLEMGRDKREIAKPSNCRDKNNCPLSGGCRAGEIVYSMEVSDINGLYISYTGGSFHKEFL